MKACMLVSDIIANILSHCHCHTIYTIVFTVLLLYVPHINWPRPSGSTASAFDYSTLGFA